VILPELSKVELGARRHQQAGAQHVLAEVLEIENHRLQDSSVWRKVANLYKLELSKISSLRRSECACELSRTRAAYKRYCFYTVSADVLADSVRV